MPKKQSAKDLLIESMLELSAKIPFDKITVADITENCGVSRKTFYNHFIDKYDLVEYIHYINFSKIADEHINSSPLISCTKMFVFICQNNDMALRKMMNESGIKEGFLKS